MSKKCAGKAGRERVPSGSAVYAFLSSSSVLSVYAGLGLVLGVYADSNKNMFSN